MWRRFRRRSMAPRRPLLFERQYALALAAAIVHPFASAHLGREPREQRSYFDVQRTVDAIERDGVAFTFHQVHRPLHAWFTLLHAAGFLVEDLREPRPSGHVVADDAALVRAREKPAFVHVRCLKPG